MTGAQVRAARAFLNWTMATLAKEAGVGISTVQEIEKLDGVPTVDSDLRWREEARLEAIRKIETAFMQEGITFRDGTIRHRRILPHD